ncbi:glucans biosynthesis glucosyltransferase MdoH [Desulfocurvibacter africanus]|uniref:glucans biosynthesis glucosyltransferase MdoH n=2 Tax=Desulfocurvibacter africanus TaxID=873 RepID=UPI00040480CD|nr:glucans biosynthesis glucosyltransferase MdoH [Desulfocurvibacter africanus]
MTVRKAILQREFLNEPWGKVAQRRRLILLLLVLAPTLAAGPTMASLLPRGGGTPLEASLTVVYSVLFAWISIGFWTSLAGFIILLRRYDRYAVTNMSERDAPERPDVRTAILFPVCNEDMDRVLAGLAATYRSLERTGRLASFDFHILSDTSDPDAWVEEELAWRRACDMLGGHGRIYYRRRRVNQKRKSGNVADFCRRFGQRYTYMAVFDADSVMSGQTLVRMVAIMERRRNVGILQSAPSAFGRETLIARASQFAGKLYGPLFAAGLHCWQLGDAPFWGHNALIRVRPFMRHCALPKLPGEPPLGGDILSHDFVEAALMRRAGWSVWLAYDLPGSHEELPPTLLDELKRDRRWCVGNLQHLRLVFTRGIFPAHRALFLNGIMSYGSALLWFVFLALSTVEAIAQSVLEPVYFSEAHSLFPEWPVWDPLWALLLLAGTGVILFLPKLLALLLVTLRGEARLFGGLPKLSASIAAEVLLSTLLAPVRMLFHSRFVFMTLLGRQVGWGGQTRDDRGTTWAEAVRFHGMSSLLALLWGLALALYNPQFLLWISPIILSLVLSVPLSVLTGRRSAGLQARRMGLFLTPDESAPPTHIAAVEKYRDRLTQTRSTDSAHRLNGFARVVLDPEALGLHLALLRGPRRMSPKVAARRDDLLAKALQCGPAGLSARERKEMLYDPERLAALHRQVWALPASGGNPWTRLLAEIGG